MKPNEKIPHMGVSHLKIDQVIKFRLDGYKLLTDASHFLISQAPKLRLNKQ